MYNQAIHTIAATFCFLNANNPDDQFMQKKTLLPCELFSHVTPNKHFIKAGLMFSNG